MNNIYFSVVDNGDVLVARVIAPGRQGEKTVILKRIMELARSMNGDDLKVIMQEFPEDSRTIKAVYVLTPWLLESAMLVGLLRFT